MFAVLLKAMDGAAIAVETPSAETCPILLRLPNDSVVAVFDAERWSQTRLLVERLTALQLAEDQNLTLEDTAQTVMDELGQSLPADPAALTFRLLFSQFSATTSGVRQLLAASSADPGPPVQAQQAIEELAPRNTYHGQGVGEIAAFLFGLLDPASALTAGQCAILAGWIVDAARKSAKREFLSGQIAVGTITEDETTIWTPAKCRLLQERLSSVDLQLRADFADLFYRGATSQ